MYDKQQFKDWYEKTKDKRQIWQKEYYQKHKEHILEVHKTWAKRKVDQTGSVWRLYGRRKRVRNPNLDKEYRLRKKARLMYKPLPEFLKGVTFKCFTPEHVKKINKTIKKSLLKKEDPSQAAAYSAKIGKFYVIPCLPLMNLIRPWLYQCQQMNALHFQYDAYWYFHLDSLNYNVYGIKGEYGWHVDANISGTPSALKLTCLLNLSEEAYEGGEFISMGQPEKLKFDSGDGLVVNSLIAHRVTPITKGERITLTYWASGPLWR